MLPGELRELAHHLRIHRLHRKQRNQPDDRLELQGRLLPSGRQMMVVVELVVLVPEPHALLADAVDRGGDRQEVLEELGRDVLVDGIVQRQLERDAQHVQAVHRHPARAVGLLDVPPVGKRPAAVEDADVVEPEEAALEDVAAVLRPCGSPTR